MARNKRMNIVRTLSAVGMIAIVLPLQLAGAEGATTDYGYTGPNLGQEIMRLHTTNQAGDSDRIYLNGAETPVDVIGNGAGNKKCQLRFDGVVPSDPRTVTGDLVTLRAFGRVAGVQSLAPSGWSVGFSNTDNSIGVGSESSSNTKCAQVNEVSPTSEVLVIELNNTEGSALGGWMWDVLELDLEAKFRPQHVYYQLWDGEEVVEEGELPICGDPTADCGPDSTDSDNWRVTIPQPSGDPLVYPSVLFDEVRIWPESDGGVVGNGSIDLKGGSDGTAPFCLVENETDGSCTEYGLADLVNASQPEGVTDSLFHLVQPAEGQICLGETIYEPEDADPEEAKASVEYLAWSGIVGEDCKAYNLDYTRNATTNERQLSFVTAGASPDATFRVAVTAWDPEPAFDPTTGNPVTVSLSLTDPAGADGDPAGEFCAGTSSDSQMPTDGLGNYTESWCAIDIFAETYGPDGTGTDDWVPGYVGQLIKVTERWLLVGDATIQRR